MNNLISFNDLDENFAQACKSERHLSPIERTMKGAKSFKRKAFGICGLRKPSEVELSKILQDLGIAENENYARDIIYSLTTTNNDGQHERGVVYAVHSDPAGLTSDFPHFMVFKKLVCPKREDRYIVNTQVNEVDFWRLK